jgi:hypothetical protein
MPEAQANAQQGTPSLDDLDAQLAADEAARSAPPAPDKPVAEDPASPDPPATEPETKEPEPVAEPEDESAADKRIARLAHAERDQRRQIAALNAELARMRGQAPALPPNEEIDHQVRTRVQAELAQAQHNQKANAIHQAGMKAFPDFETQLIALRDVGGLSPEMIEAASETGEAHKIFNYLGKNLDEAERVMGLAPAAQGAALARIAAKVSAAPAPKAQSKVPPPIKPVSGGSNSAEPDESKMSMADYCALEDDRQFNRRRR